MTITQASLDFIAAHRDDDVRQLALTASRDDGIDIPWALDQIAGRQHARGKLPQWAACDGLIYPPHIALEQCSSQRTAEYKAAIARRLIMHCGGADAGTVTDVMASKTVDGHDGPVEDPGVMPATTLVDLTGGFGVDCSFMARAFDRAVYVDIQPHLCETVKHNFALLGLERVKVVGTDAQTYLESMGPATLIYMDPSRRDAQGERTYAIADCTPNLLGMLPDLLRKAPFVMVKLSPMLDWRKAVADCGGYVSEVHIVSTDNVCRELLLVMERERPSSTPVRVIAVNDAQVFEFDMMRSASQVDGVCREDGPDTTRMPTGVRQRDLAGYRFLYEPNASLMKAGCFDLIARHFGVRQIATNSHLFLSNRRCEMFPGRMFVMEQTTTMGKRDMRSALQDLRQANIAVRNFPMSVAALRRKLKLKDGGETYLFATTTADGTHMILRATKGAATAVC